MESARHYTALNLSSFPFPLSSLFPFYLNPSSHLSCFQFPLNLSHEIPKKRERQAKKGNKIKPLVFNLVQTKLSRQTVNTPARRILTRASLVKRNFLYDTSLAITKSGIFIRLSKCDMDMRISEFFVLYDDGKSERDKPNDKDKETKFYRKIDRKITI